MLCLKLKIRQFADDSQRRPLYELSRRVQEATNFFWQRWELWHVTNDSPAKVRAYLADLEAWRSRHGLAKPKLPPRTPRPARQYAAAVVGHFKALKRGQPSGEPTPPAGLHADLVLAMRDYARACADFDADKPKLEVDAYPAAFGNEFYKALRDAFPDLTARVRVLLQNKLAGLAINMKSACGALSGWMAILLCRQGRPSTTHPAPIPFDADNAIVWRDDEGMIRLRARLARDEDDGSGEDLEVQLETAGRAARYAAPLYAVAADAEGRKQAVDAAARIQRALKKAEKAGEPTGRLEADLARARAYRDTFAKLAGSSLGYDESARQWYALVSYQPPEEPKPELDRDIAIVIRPARRHPWTIRVGGRSRWIGGHGEHVAHRRRQVIEGRWSRQENYRAGTRNRKGHGRGSALINVVKLEKSWRTFCKTFNEHVVSEILKRCVEARAGRLVLLRPARARFLDVAGKNPERNDGSAWPWHQFEAFLRRKCAWLGIELVESRQRVRADSTADRVRAAGV